MIETRSLSDFFKQKGYFCPSCKDLYSLVDSSKKPTLLSCAQHNVCIGCLESLGNEWENCPTCSKSIVVDLTKVEPNSLTMTAMEDIKDLWAVIQQKIDEVPVESVQVAAKPVVDPEQYENLMLCEAYAKCQSRVADIRALKIQMVNLRFEESVKRWARKFGITSDFILEDFKTKPECFFVYSISGRAQGFFQFEINNGQLNIRRWGLLDESMEYQTHFFREFFLAVKPHLNLEYDAHPVITYSRNVNEPATFCDELKSAERFILE